MNLSRYRSLWLFPFAWFAVSSSVSASPESLAGAWKSTEGTADHLLLVVDGYLTCTSYDPDAPQFNRTFGGPLVTDGDALTLRVHFDSDAPENVGEERALEVDHAGSALRLDLGKGSVENWRRIEEQAGPLTGVWRITGRQREGKIDEMPLRARRTLKVLTGSRFQWIAMNIETGEFSGTGGGSYTFDDGIYVETIEFFSRDNSRVGAQLEFDGEIEDGDWHHSGLSSRGDPIYEIWSKLGPEDRK